MMKAAVQFSGLDLKIHPVSFPKEGRYDGGTLDVLDLRNIDARTLKYQVVSAECGRAAFAYVQKVIELALAKEVDATVTGPIHKEALNLAGFHYAGHTDKRRVQQGEKESRSDRDQIGPKHIAAIGDRAAAHRGGRVKSARMAGGQYDVVVAMYHDQGHIPTKLLGFRYDAQTDTWGSISGVNITCGLPIIRVSVDHGTAFDKAGEGRANPESMLQAIHIATQLASHQRRGESSWIYSLTC